MSGRGNLGRLLRLKMGGRIGSKRLKTAVVVVLERGRAGKDAWRDEGEGMGWNCGGGVEMRVM